MSVQLIGTTLTPAETGNAVVLYVSSSKFVTVKDPAGNPVKRAQVYMFDINSKKYQVYYTDDNGVVKLPDLPVETFGNWYIEVIKKDYDTGIIYHYLKKYSETPSEITCETGTDLIVTVTYKFEPTALENWAKGAYEWLPDWLKPVANWFGNVYGWTKKQLIELLWNVLAKKHFEGQGVKVTSIVYDEATNELKISYHQKDIEPVTAITVIVVVTVLAVTAIFATPYIADMVSSLTGAKVVEEASKQNEVYKDMLDTITKAYEQGAIDKDTYEKAVENITETIKWQQSNLPKYTIPWSEIVTVLGIGLVIWLVISLIKTIRETRR